MKKFWAGNVCPYCRNLLSKSSPAFFSSCHSSDEPQDNTYYGSNISENTSRTNNSTYSPNRYNSQENSFNQIPSIVSPERKNSGQRSGSTLLKQIFVILSVIGVAMACNYMDIFTDILISNNQYDELSFYNDVTNLGQKYRLSDNSLLQIKSGKFFNVIG